MCGSFITGQCNRSQESDSVESKISGAAINALIFVATVTVATFGIFLLFKYRCTKVIWGIMGISGISVFLLFGYNIFLAVLQVMKGGKASDLHTLSPSLALSESVL